MTSRSFLSDCGWQHERTLEPRSEGLVEPPLRGCRGDAPGASSQSQWYVLCRAPSVGESRLKLAALLAVGSGLGAWLSGAWPCWSRSRQMSKEDFGDLALVLAIVGIAITVADAGFSRLIVRDVARGGAGQAALVAELLRRVYPASCWWRLPWASGCFGPAWAVLRGRRRPCCGIPVRGGHRIRLRERRGRRRAPASVRGGTSLFAVVLGAGLAALIVERPRGPDHGARRPGGGVGRRGVGPSGGLERR